MENINAKFATGRLEALKQGTIIDDCENINFDSNYGLYNSMINLFTNGYFDPIFNSPAFNELSTEERRELLKKGREHIDLCFDKGGIANWAEYASVRYCDDFDLCFMNVFKNFDTLLNILRYGKEDSVEFKTDHFSEFAIIIDDLNGEIPSEVKSVLKAPAEQTRALRTISNDLDVWDGSVASRFSLGSGTAQDPYLINSASELAYLASRVNDGTNYANQYFQLTRDIDLNNREWTPIGDATYSFAGIFNGSGRSIKNAAITASGSVTMTSNTFYSFGFFGSIGTGSNYAIIENVVFDNINVTYTSSFV